MRVKSTAENLRAVNENGLWWFCWQSVCRESREHAKMMDEMLITLWGKMFPYQKK